MDLIEKINACRNSKELDSLRDEIHLAASYNEIDFKFVKRVFLEQKKIIRDREWGYRA